ncbi:MAG: AI-2E family transporter [Solirubrobacteraceae bacterium]
MATAPSSRQVVRLSLSVAGTAGALYLLYLLRGVLELMALGLFVALWLGPVVEFLTRRRVPRVVAILTAYVALLGSIVFLGLVAVPPIVSQIEGGVRELPVGIAKLRQDRLSASTTTSTRSRRSWRAKHASFPAVSPASRNSCRR